MTEPGTSAADHTGLRRAGAVLLTAGGLMVALAGPAQADPTAAPSPTQQAGTVDPAAATDAAAKPQTADELIAYIEREYDTGAGGGQVSNLIHSVMKLRAQGYKPSKANVDEILKALDYRPNTTPLIAALKDTLAYQLKIKQRAEASQNQGGGPTVIGINQMPQDPYNPGNGIGISIQPGG